MYLYVSFRTFLSSRARSASIRYTRVCHVGLFSQIHRSLYWYIQVSFHRHTGLFIMYIGLFSFVSLISGEERERQAHSSVLFFRFLFIGTYVSWEVGGWGRDPKKCTGSIWGMGSSTIQWALRPVVKYHLRRGVGLIQFLKMVLDPSPPPLVRYLLCLITE